MDILHWDGQLIAEPGVYDDIPIDAYHQQLTVEPSISSSGLRTIFSQSPRAYFRTSYLNPLPKQKKPSEAFIFGRAAHHLLLGERDFSKHFVVRPEKAPDGRDWHHANKSCQEWLKGAAEEELTVLTQRDIEIIRAMAHALEHEPLIQTGILGGLIEHSFVWRDPETGVWLKWRPDGIPTASLDFADLKTCESVDDEALERSFGAYGYEMQGALGAIACREVLGQEMNSFSLIYCEKEDTLPLIRVKQAKAGDIELGERCIRAALRLFARCLETGKWPGPSGFQGDAEYIGLHPRAAEHREYRLQEVERQLGDVW